MLIALWTLERTVSKTVSAVSQCLVYWPASTSVYDGKMVLTIAECGESAIQRVHKRVWQRTHNPFCAGTSRRQHQYEGRNSEWQEIKI